MDVCILATRHRLDTPSAAPLAFPPRSGSALQSPPRFYEAPPPCHRLKYNTVAAMEISGGQGANGPQLFELAPIFLEMGVTVAPIFWSQKASKFDLPAKYNQNFARAFGART